MNDRVDTSRTRDSAAARPRHLHPAVALTDAAEGPGGVASGAAAVAETRDPVERDGEDGRRNVVRLEDREADEQAGGRAQERRERRNARPGKWQRGEESEHDDGAG